MCPGVHEYQQDTGPAQCFAAPSGGPLLQGPGGAAIENIWQVEGERRYAPPR